MLALKTKQKFNLNKTKYFTVPCRKFAALYPGKPQELRSCVTVEVAVLGSPSLIVFMVSVDEKQH